MLAHIPYKEKVGVNCLFGGSFWDPQALFQIVMGRDLQINENRAEAIAFSSTVPFDRSIDISDSVSSAYNRIYQVRNHFLPKHVGRGQEYLW